MISAQQVAELVLVAEFLVPVGAKEKVRSALARPPRLLEVVVEVRVAPDERVSDARAYRRDLIRRERAGCLWHLRDRHVDCCARAQREREQASSYVPQYFSSIGNGCYAVGASAVPAANRS